MKPIFEYAKDGENVYVPCYWQDAERTHYWCTDSLRWIKSRCDDIHNIWRKKIKIPDGWELIPKGAPVSKGDRYWALNNGNEWIDVSFSEGLAGDSTRTSLCYIRKSPENTSAPLSGWTRSLNVSCKMTNVEIEKLKEENARLRQERDSALRLAALSDNKWTDRDSDELERLTAPTLKRETTLNVDKLVNEFLAWPLPESVCVDECARIAGYKNRIGTNLLGAIEARQMFEYVLARVSR